MFVLCRSDNPEGLDVYMHILQLLTTVDEGIQAIGKNLELLCEGAKRGCNCWITTYLLGRTGIHILGLNLLGWWVLFLSFSSAGSWWRKRDLEFALWPRLPGALPARWSTHHCAGAEDCAGLYFVRAVCYVCFTDRAGIHQDEEKQVILFCLFFFFFKLIFIFGFMWVWKVVQFSGIAYSKTLPWLLKITASPKFTYWVDCNSEQLKYQNLQILLSLLHWMN